MRCRYKSNLKSLGAMLLDLERRRGWEALGYSSCIECAIAEFGKSQGYVYKLLHAAEVDENLAASEIYPLDKSEIALIPTSHKEELHKLPFDQQAEALQKVVLPQPVLLWHSICTYCPQPPKADP